MGNKKFKFSDMIPNAWFYKLRDMGKNNRYRNKKNPATSSSSSSSVSNSSSLFSSLVSTDSNSTSIQQKTKQSQIFHHRQSYHFTRNLSPPHSHSVIETKLPNSPLKPPKHRNKIKENRASSDNQNSPILISSDSLKSIPIHKYRYNDSHFDVFGPNSEEKSPNIPNISPKLKIRNRAASENGNYPKRGFSKATLNTLENNSIGLDPVSQKNSQLMIRKAILCDNPNCQTTIPSDSENSVSNSVFQNLDTNASGFCPISKSKLPRIITKMETEAKKEKKINTPRKQRCSVFTGVRLRSNSPRIGNINESGRKSFNSGGRRKNPESFAVVKSSSDPKKDFRESMVEMILENGINDSKELEDLLFCYLQLNCDVYHEVIIEVFKQIWFDLVNVKV